MFGYINVNGKELSDEERETYQSYYCGLCRTLRKNFGSKGQLVLNYDMTFLVVLLTGLYEVEEETGEFKCALHPLKSRISRRNEITEYASYMNVLLAYYNLVDDWKDDRNYLKKSLAMVYEKEMKDIEARFPRQKRAVEQYIENITECEARGETNLDLVASLTGEMLGEIFAYKEDVWYDELKNLGMYMGKFIYLMDAYEDLNRDEKKNAYNPLKKVAKENGEDYETLVKAMMTSMMSECAKTFERLPILTHAKILRNILYSGVWSKYEYIQLKKRKRKK